MRSRILAALLLALLSLGAAAQAGWPAKPVKIVVPFPPGGSTDTMTRAIADKLGTALGQPVAVENKPGAGGQLGAEFAARSAPDGYTLLMGTGSTHSVAPALGRVPYDAERDFAPVVWVGSATNLLVVSPKLGVSSVQELIALAKQKPGQLKYASSGVGSVSHLTTEMFASMAGVKLEHVPYKGTQQAIPDLVSGEAALLFDAVITSKQHVQSGRVKALAISSEKRSGVVPNVPTVGESGLKGFESANWFGLFAPANTPRAIVDRLNKEINHIISSDAAVRARFQELGFDIAGGAPAELAKVLKSETQKWAGIVREANVKVK